jgi:hypothetical protein
MNDEPKPIEYADPALNKPSRQKDLLLLTLVGMAFAAVFGAFLLWWTLFL